MPNINARWAWPLAIAVYALAMHTLGWNHPARRKAMIGGVALASGWLVVVIYTPIIFPPAIAWTLIACTAWACWKMAQGLKRAVVTRSLMKL